MHQHKRFKHFNFENAKNQISIICASIYSRRASYFTVCYNMAFFNTQKSDPSRLFNSYHGVKVTVFDAIRNSYRLVREPHKK